VKRIAIIGPNADVKMGEAGGSSQIKSPYEVTPLEGIKQRCEGIEIVEDPQEADITIAVCGLNHKGGFGDSEGNDRAAFDLPKDQVDLIMQSVEKCSKTVLVLVNGTPVGLSDELVASVPTIMEAWYAGMEGGNAIASILFGDVNPSGKLPVTFPKRLQDVAAHASVETYPGIDDEEAGPTVRYDEGIFVGYRKSDIEPLFAFGHGLSYTTFEYSNIVLNELETAEDHSIAISVDVTNAGNRAGAEVVQLYMHDVESSVERPAKELKGFRKVFIEPGQKETITFEIRLSDLAFFDESKNDWNAEPGAFQFLIGSSSRDIRLEATHEFT